MQGNERSAGDDMMIVEEDVDRPKPSMVVVGYGDENSVVLDALPNHLYQVIRIGSAKKLIEYLRISICDVVIIDAVLKGEDSLSIVRELSSNSNSFMILVRSETDDEVDRVLALELGADDCVAFSCKAREIKARVGALLRRRSKETQTSREYTAEHRMVVSALTFQGWVVNKDRCQLFSPSGEAISLTSVEYGILVGLFSDPGAVKDRSSLRNIETDSIEYDMRSLDVFVCRLRKKMGNYGGQNLIETVRGKGYRLASITGGM